MRLGSFDLAALGAPGRPGRLDLAAYALQGAPGWLEKRGPVQLNALASSIWAQIECPNDAINKKNDLLIDDLASTLPASCALERSLLPRI